MNSELSSIEYFNAIVQTIIVIVNRLTDDAIIFDDINTLEREIKNINPNTIAKNVLNIYSYKNLAQWLSQTIEIPVSFVSRYSTAFSIFRP